MSSKHCRLTAVFYKAVTNPRCVLTNTGESCIIRKIFRKAGESHETQRKLLQEPDYENRIPDYTQDMEFARTICLRACFWRMMISERMSAPALCRGVFLFGRSGFPERNTVCLKYKESTHLRRFSRRSQRRARSHRS